MLELTKATMREMRERERFVLFFERFSPFFRSLLPSLLPPCLLDFHRLPAVAMHHQISRALFQPESFHRRCTLFIYIEDIRTMTTARTETIVVPLYRLCYTGGVCFASNSCFFSSFSFYFYFLFIYLFARYNSNNFFP